MASSGEFRMARPAVVRMKMPVDSLLLQNRDREEAVLHQGFDVFFKGGKSCGIPGEFRVARPAVVRFSRCR